VVTAQEQRFNVDLGRQEVDAREQFRRDLLDVKEKAHTRWYYHFGVPLRAVKAGWSKYEAGESASFEEQLEAWKSEQHTSFGKYRSDVLGADLYSLRQVSLEPMLRGVGSYKFAGGRGDTLRTEYVPKTPEFGVDYDIRDVSRWAKTQATPSFREPMFGRDYDILEVSRWAKTQSKVPSQEAVFGVDYTTKDVAKWAKKQTSPAKQANDILAFQGIPHKADVSWDVDVKIHEPVTFSNEFSEEKLVPAVFGKDYNMKDLARFAKTLTSKPVFGTDYTMKDVSAWAKKQAGPVFGVDYTMHDVAAWAKTQPSIGQVAREDQASYEAKQAKSREFYTKLGYPQYGGQYDPFTVPSGYGVAGIGKTDSGLEITFEQQPKQSTAKPFYFPMSVLGTFQKANLNDVPAIKVLAKALAVKLPTSMVIHGGYIQTPTYAEGKLTVRDLLVASSIPAVALLAPELLPQLGLSATGLLGSAALSVGVSEGISYATARKFLTPTEAAESGLLGVAFTIGGTAVFHGLSKAAHGLYDWKIKGSSFEKALVEWAWKDPALSGFEKTGLEQIPHMDTSYLKSSSFITGYEQNTGLSSGLRGLIRARLPLSELTVGLPTLPGYMPGAAEEALVKGSVGLGGYDMKWLPRLQAGLEFGDMMASPGAAGFGLTVPAPLAAVGVSNVGRVYAFELMAMPSGFASGFARSSADKWASAGFIDESSNYDMSMSKGGRFFKETMPSDYLAGFSRNEYPLLEIGRNSLGVREFTYSSEYGFSKSGKSLQDMGLVSLSRETFMPTALTMRLPYTEGQLAERSFLRLSSLPALSLTFGKTALKSWNMPSVPLPMYMTRNLNLLSKQKQQLYVDETQFLSYPGVDVGYQQVMKPSQMFKESNVLFDLQRSQFITDWRQKQEQKPMLGLLGSYSFKPSLESASLLRLSSARESLPSLQKMDYGLQSSKSSFLFGLSGFGLSLDASTGSRMIMRSVEAQTQKLYVGQRQLQLQVPKTLVLIKPAAEVGFPPQHPFFEDVGYKKRKQRKIRMTKEYPFGKFLRVTPVMTAKEYRKLMLG
jgi:hypothetical protein